MQGIIQSWWCWTRSIQRLTSWIGLAQIGSTFHSFPTFSGIVLKVPKGNLDCLQSCTCDPRTTGWDLGKPCCIFLVLVISIFLLVLNTSPPHHHPHKRQGSHLGFRLFLLFLLSVQFRSVIQLCPTLCSSINRNMPGLLVHHQLPEFSQTHIHPTISSSISPFFSCLQSFPASGSFPMSQLFKSGGHSIGVLASTSVLPMNTQDWSPLGWTGWISLQSKGLSRVFSNTTVQKHQFFGAQLSL